VHRVEQTNQVACIFFRIWEKIDTTRHVELSNNLKTTMPRKVFIHATNVHQGGGYSLLHALLKAHYDKTQFVLCLDERMSVPEDMKDNIQIKRVKPSVMQRLNAERWLAQNVSDEDTVLCFGNLPPLFKLRGHTVVFVQNRYLIDDVSLNKFPLRVGLRLAIERQWLTVKMSNTDEFVVQTPTMKRLLEIKTQGVVPISVLPFVAEPDGYVRKLAHEKLTKENEFDFLYVASGEPHKNHRRLIEAWCLLAEEGLFPSLSLTLEEARFSELCREIEVKRQQYGLHLTNVGGLSHSDVLALYARAGAVIYPSNFESFGLPLIEARQAGLPVLASELDYVRDVLDPEQTFDPESSVSIARSVKRFMGLDEPALPLLDATGFLASILGKAK
jgi:glycosyltransferase involved in cell wall biosynthesis